MKRLMPSVGAILLLAGVTAAPFAFADGKGKHTHASSPQEMLDQMREVHKHHQHKHDFEAIATLPPEQMKRVMEAMQEIGLVVPSMDSHRGKELFLNKGCVVCHQVRGVGGEVGPSLNADDMAKPMNAFEFAARMWRGAEAMIQTQEQIFGNQITLSGQDLADLVAFAHDQEKQSELTNKDIPEKFRKLIR